MRSCNTQDRVAQNRARGGCFSAIATSDPCEHALSLRDWSQDYLQLSAGPFSGEIVEASIETVQVFKESISQCIDEKANPRPNSYTVGIPIEVEEGGFWQGRPLAPDSVMSLRANEELHFRTPRESSILVAVIDSSTFDQYAQETAGLDVAALISRAQCNHLPPAVAQYYRSVLSEVLVSVASTPEVFEYRASAKALAETVMNASLVALSARSGRECPSRGCHSVQRAIVERARNYILSNREDPPSVSDLSAYLKMSRRGLHHAFMNVLGINLNTFIRFVRLHGVRKDLLGASATDSVSGIACKWGFWHMGMFCSYYKALFGETPSTTIRQRQKQASAFGLDAIRKIDLCAKSGDLLTTD